MTVMTLVWGLGLLANVAVSVALGWLVDRAGTEVIAIAFLVTYLGQGILALMLPNDGIAVRHTVKGPLLQVLQVPGFSLFLASAAVSQACHGFFYSYSALYWKSLGFSASTIGYLWALGVLAEITSFTCGSLLAAPDVYMQKIAIGPGYPAGIVDLDASPIEPPIRPTPRRDTFKSPNPPNEWDKPEFGWISAA